MDPSPDTRAISAKLSDTDVQAMHPRWRPIFLRVLFILILATLVGWTLNRIGKAMEGSPQPAGFSRGMIQGALMPMTLPNLLVGNDVAIYSQKNTGRTYKLGYTLGVNTCGALFFGLFFWRVSRWRRDRSVRQIPKGQAL